MKEMGPLIKRSIERINGYRFVKWWRMEINDLLQLIESDETNFMEDGDHTVKK